MSPEADTGTIAENRVFQVQGKFRYRTNLPQKLKPRAAPSPPVRQLERLQDAPGTFIDPASSTLHDNEEAREKPWLPAIPLHKHRPYLRPWCECSWNIRIDLCSGSRAESETTGKQPNKNGSVQRFDGTPGIAPDTIATRALKKVPAKEE